VEVMFQQPEDAATPQDQAGFGAGELAAPAQFAAEQIVDPASRNADDPATWGKVGRNEPCPCGSGKKFKHCHGALSA
jgi:preprotein translocase subunit SecA